MEPIHELGARPFGHGQIDENDGDAVHPGVRLPAHRTQSIQPESAGSHPLNFITLVTRKRIADHTGAVGIVLNQ